MAARKSLETMSGVILNRLQPKFAAKSVANEMRPVRGKGVCSDSNRTAQRLQMAARKSLETMSGMILNRLQPKFAAKSVANEMLPVLGKGVCSEVYELLGEHWVKIVQSEKISTPIYVECDKMYQSKVCVQEFSYFVSGLDIQLEKSEYDSPVRKKKSVTGGEIRYMTRRSRI